MSVCGHYACETLVAGGPALVSAPVLPLDNPDMPVDGIRVLCIHLGHMRCISEHTTNDSGGDVCMCDARLRGRPPCTLLSSVCSCRRRTVYLRSVAHVFHSVRTTPHLVVDHSLATANGRMANAICRGEYNHGGVTLGDTLVDPHTSIDDATTPVHADMRPLTDASG